MRIAISANSDGDCTEELRIALDPIADGDLTIDLSQVPYLPSSALTELARLRRRMRNEPIVLYGPNALVTRTLNVVGFNKIFTIVAAPAAGAA